MNILRQLEIEHMKATVPDFGVGDTVDVHYQIKEGEKERIQVFSGTVIAIRGRGIRRSALVRRIVAGEGVERSFPVHSPKVADVKVRTRGKVRRAKLYYLRELEGKATRVKPNMGKPRFPRSLKSTTLRPADAPAPAADAAPSES
ncbi:MAG: 50S ribosomal protein L19 [Planctomycetota bacterium]